MTHLSKSKVPLSRSSVIVRRSNQNPTLKIWSRWRWTLLRSKSKTQNFRARVIMKRPKIYPASLWGEAFSTRNNTPKKGHSILKPQTKRLVINTFWFNVPTSKVNVLNFKSRKNTVSRSKTTSWNFLHLVTTHSCENQHVPSQVFQLGND